MKKNIFFFIIILFLLNNSLRAQVRFQHVYGGSGYEDVQEVIETPDGGYITCGTTESFGAGQSDIFVVKTDDAGVVQWSKAYGSPGNEFGAAIKKAPAGGYIIAGYTYGLSTDTLTDDFLLIKINSAGTVQWSKTYGGPDNDEAHALTVMPDSGFVIAGTTASFGGATNQSGFVVRTDKDGNKLWSKAVTQNSDQQLFAVDATDDGGCIVAGYTYVTSLTLFDVFVAKLAANGTKQWIRSYGGFSSEQAYSVKQSLSGGYVVAGYTASFGTGQDDAFIMRLSNNGSLTWFNAYGTNESERARTVLWGTNDGIIIGGQAKVSSPVGPIDNNFLLKTDTSGTVLWAKTYGPSVNISLAYSTALCSDGGFVMGGLTGGFGAQQNDIYLVKTNDLGGSGCNQVNWQLFSSAGTPADTAGGTLTTGGIENTVTAVKTNTIIHTFIQCNSTGLGISENTGETKNMFYPNPANNEINIITNAALTGNIKIQISDPEGKLMLSETFEDFKDKIKLPVNHFPAGIYFVNMTSGKMQTLQKLIIQR
jgi:hypothetical protein